MYSRNRVMTAEQRYAENLPPVYGGSRFYRGTPSAPKEAGAVRETVPAVTPEAGIPVQYAVRSGGMPEAACAETEAPAPAPWEEDVPGAPCAEEESSPVDAGPLVCTGEGAREEHNTANDCAVRTSGREGVLSSLFSGDSEEILLIVLILLLGGEAERAADVIVILLLLLVVR